MRPFVIATIAALLATPVAIGCGEGDDDEGTVSTTTTEEDTTPDFALVEKGTLTVGSNIPYSPFEEGDPPDYEGFDIDLINEVADNLDLDTRIEPTPFDVILEGGDGRFDLAISAVEITPARDKQVDFSEPYFTTTLGLLVRADSDVSSVKDLKRASIVATEIETSGAAYANDHLRVAEIRSLPSADDAFNALFNGEVDAVIAEGSEVEDAAATRQGLEVAEIFAADEHYGIVVPEGKPGLLEAVDQALLEIKGEGVIDELYDEYFGIEPPEELTKPGQADT